MAAAGLWTTPSDLCKAALAIMQSNAGRVGAFLNQNLARTMLTRGLGQYGLGVRINNSGWFYHDGVNEGYRALLYADPQAQLGYDRHDQRPERRSCPRRSVSAGR